MAITQEVILKVGTNTAVASIQDLRDNIRSYSNDLVGLDRSSKDYKDAVEAAAKSELRLKQIREDITKAIREQSAAQGLNTKQLNTAKGSMNEISDRLGKLRAAYRALSETQREGAKGTAMLDQITQLDEKIKSLDATIGNHQRNVGDYKTAFNGLNVAMSQIVRELPALAISPQMFFLAISNNLGPLNDEINRIREEINAGAAESAKKQQEAAAKVVVAENKKTAATQKLALAQRAQAAAIAQGNAQALATANRQIGAQTRQIALAEQQLAVQRQILATQQNTATVFSTVMKSFLSWNTVIMVGITLLTTLAPKIIDWIGGMIKGKDSTDAAKIAQEQFNKALSEGVKNSSNEVTRLDILYKASQDVTRSMKERNDAVDAMQREYPKYFENMTNEEILAGKAAIGYNALTKAIKKTAQAKALEQLAVDNYKKIEEAKLEIEEFKKISADFEEIANGGISSIPKMWKTGIKLLGDDIGYLGLSAEEIKEKMIENLTLKEEDIKAMEAANEELIKKIDVSSLVDADQKAFEEAKKKDAKAKEDAKKAADLQKQTQEKAFQTEENFRKEMERLEEQSKKRRIEGYEKDLKEGEKFAERKVDIEKSAQELVNDIYQESELELTEFDKEQAKERLDAAKEEVEKKKELYSSIMSGVDGVQSIMGQLSNLYDMDAQNQIGALSIKQKGLKKDSSEYKKIEAEKEKVSKDAFEKKKNIDAANATIDAFKSASGAYASMSSIPVAGPFLGAAAAAAALTFGLKQVQMIKQQQYMGGSTESDSTETNLPSMPELRQPIQQTQTYMSAKDEDVINRTQPVLVVEDLNQVQNRVRVAESESRF